MSAPDSTILLSALRESEDRYRDLFENSGLFIGAHDAEGRILTVNQTVLDCLGTKDADELIGRSVSDFLPEKAKPLFQDYLKTALTEGKAAGLVKFKLPGGQSIFIEYTNSLRRDTGGSPVVRCIGRDVTKRARAEAALRESEERLRLALTAAGTGVWEWNLITGAIIGDDYVRGLLDGASGIASVLKKIHPDDRELLKSSIQTNAEDDRIQNLQFRVINGKGEERWVEGSARLRRDESGRLERAIGVVRDITEKKQFEAVVLRAQRLESIGSLASAIAHDLNNVLAPILMALHTLRQRFTDENSQRWLSLMSKSAERGRDLIERVLAFARGAEGERAPLRTIGLIRDIARILKDTLPKNIELQVQAPENLWSVIGDATQIQQVLMNLCINARDAMPGGGKLTIKARNRYLVEEEKRLVTNPLQKQYVRITVADTGVGIPQEIIDRVFDPFFTTKDKGKGSGLGLSTALAIVRGHGGFVTLFSKVGKGTEFKVYLPAQETGVVESADAVETDLPPGRGELILIVDDEADIREITSTTLGKYGYRVLLARDGQEAVEIYRQRGSEIDLVVTDMVMPNLDGPSTIRALREIDPNALVIASSGERTLEKMDDIKRLGVCAFLPKPYTAEKLLEVVAESLNGHSTISSNTDRTIPPPA
jgi:PAS domain S-box-containing protein